MSLCACGCGQETVGGKKYLQYHYQKNIHKKPQNLQKPEPIIKETELPPTRRDKEIELKRLELLQIDKFMGERKQNTQITLEEQVLLAVLYTDLAQNPWAISKRVCEDMGIPFNPKEFEIDFLKAFITDYLDFGLPVLREGRKEVKDVFTAYFRGEEKENPKPKEKLIT